MRVDLKLVHGNDGSDGSDFVACAVQQSDYDTVLRPGAEPLALYHGGHLVALVMSWPSGGHMLAAARSLRYTHTSRSGGMLSDSRTFGFSPRLVVRREQCSECATSSEYPLATEAFYAGAAIAHAEFLRNVPERALLQATRIAQEVGACWRIRNSMFTGCIVNRSSALMYHRDGGNFSDTWNAQFTLAETGVIGGLFVLPEFRVALDLRDTLMFLDASKWVHGVTRISGRGNRYSVVYFATAGMARCERTVDLEMARARQKRAGRESAKAHGGDDE